MSTKGSFWTGSGSIASLLTVVITGAALVGCNDPSAPGNEQNMTPAAPVPQPAPSPTGSAAPPTLTRMEFLEAAARAASDYAGGQTSSADKALVGRAFTVRIPFGCSGPSTEGSEQPGVAQWLWSADGKNIQLTMVPADWTRSAMIVQAGATSTWEAIEGFWVPRPWISSEGCPSIKADPLETATAASPNTLGLAAVFAPGGSRVGRREGRAYQFTIRPEGAAPLTAPARGYRLLLQGRLESFPSGRAIECRAPNPDARPVCVAAARLDRAAFETADGEVLADWRTD